MGFYWVGWGQAMPGILLVGSDGFVLGRVGPGNARYFIGGQWCFLLGRVGARQYQVFY